MGSQNLKHLKKRREDVYFAGGVREVADVDPAQGLQDANLSLRQKLAEAEHQVGTESMFRRIFEREACVASSACKMYFSMAQAAEEKAKAAEARECIVQAVLSRAVHTQAEKIFQLHRWIGRAQGILQAHGLEVPPGGAGDGDGDDRSEASSAMSGAAFCVQ